MSAGGRGGGLVFNTFLQNLVMERNLWLRRQLDPRRDIDAECGHPETILPNDFKRSFLRGDIAKRVVTVMPEESWSESPQIFETEDETETEFEKTWTQLEKDFHIFSILQRADILSGIGRFGILLLGIDDGLDLGQPVAALSPTGETIGDAAHQLLYLRPFDEDLVQINKWEVDTKNPRYGLPTEYSIRFEDTTNLSAIPGSSSTGTLAPAGMTSRVHWSRIIHLADNRTSSDVYGLPRMEVVFNRLLDLRKIAGGSGEMFWKGGFPGISLEAMLNENESVDIDIEDVKKQMEAYMNGLQRYLALTGMQAKSLGTQVADPGPHIEAQIKLISMAIGVPWRVFVGSEAAQLASEQDSRAWYRRLARRRSEYLTPYVLLPFVERLIAFGVLPEPAEVRVDWPDLNTLSEQDKATVAEKQTNAISKYVQAGADLLMPPFHFLTLVLGMPDDEARAVLDEAEEAALEESQLRPQPPAPAPAPGQRNGRPTQTQTRR